MSIAVLAAIIVNAAAQPPSTRVDSFRETLHGVQLEDPYPWLDNLQSPESRDWIARQNRYSEGILGKLKSRDALRQRLMDLYTPDSLGAPAIAGGRYFFMKTPAGGRPLLCVRASPAGPDRVLVDPAVISKDPSAGVELMDVSSDGNLAAFSIRESGRDEIQIGIVDSAGHRLPVTLPLALYSGFRFDRNGKGFHCVRRSRESGSRVFHQDLAGNETLAFDGARSPAQFVSVSQSPDGSALLIWIQSGWSKVEALLKKGTAEPVPLISAADARFSYQFSYQWAGPRQLAVSTTWEAPRRRIFLIDLDNPARGRWREVVPQSPDNIESFSVAGGKLFVNYLHDVHSLIKVFELSGKASGEVTLPGTGTGAVHGNWDRTRAVTTFTSFTDPAATYLYDTASGKREPWSQPRVAITNTDFETRQVWYASKDGTKVPMYLVHRKGLTLDGNRPVLLYGYGGFNVSQSPRFMPEAVIFAERGGVFALANIRGGSEFGEQWHRAGMLDRKQSVFDDFIAAAEWLIANKYTNPKRLAIQGRSNGGLLMGAALTQRPDLFRAVICQYPDLDMIRYYRYTKSNNPPALLEYGNAAKPEEFAFLRKYSPYEAVKKGTNYPAIYLSTGDGDTRVPPPQACKMAAKLQSATASGLPVVLRYDVGSGHAGGRSRDVVAEHYSGELAFVMAQLVLNSVNKFLY